MYRLKHKLWMDSDYLIRPYIIAEGGSPQGAYGVIFFFNMAINFTIRKVNEMIISDGALWLYTGSPLAVATTVIYKIDQFKKLGLTIHIKKMLFTLLVKILLMLRYKLMVFLNTG